jgi:hypothetical protein
MPKKLWQPGESGNPAGRPPKSRALTAILERAGSRTIDIDGKKTSGKQLLGRLLWQGVTEGMVNLPDGTKLELGPRDWFEMAKFIYSHIDGPPKQTLEHTGEGGGPIQTEVVVRWPEDTDE